MIEENTRIEADEFMIWISNMTSLLHGPEYIEVFLDREKLSGPILTIYAVQISSVLKNKPI